MKCVQRMNWLTLALICPLLSGAPSSRSARDVSCPSENLNITGGSYILSNGYSDESFLRYICPIGYYPSVQVRYCRNGFWTPETSTKLRPECKKVTCPNPRVLENGEVAPYKERYYVNDKTTYSCYSDYKFHGSEVRVCKSNGKWSGSTPVCGRDSDHCPDPGVPPGSSRTGNTFNIGDQVTYRCGSSYTLMGSKVRVCQENGQWSGTEPQCYKSFTYDTAEDASKAFSSSLKTTLVDSQRDENRDQHGKKIVLGNTGELDIYIAVDVSSSLGKETSKKAKNIIKTLINKLSDYEVSPNYEILMFSADVKRIIFKSDEAEGNLGKVFEKLDNFVYDSDRTDTNIAKVYHHILESMILEETKNKDAFLETQQIIIIFTDGKANIGGNPKPKVEQIINHVIKNDPRREYKLDLYVFGVGADVNTNDLNGLASHKDKQRHFFKLPDFDEVQKTFDMTFDMMTDSCSKTNLNIIGGTFVLSNGYSNGSLLRYICPIGYYPSVYSRHCQDKFWTPKTSSKKTAECKINTCLNPHVLENGEVVPYKQMYSKYDTTTYTCHRGYNLRGSESRVCQSNGKWSGSTPVCGRDSDHCPDPGVPPGSRRTGNTFNIGDQVTYRCGSSYTLMGSKVRVCQENGQWSGTEPQCYTSFMYDSAEEASEAFRISLKTTLDEDQHEKKLTLNMYIAVDVRDTLEKESVDKAKNIIKTLIDKLSYFDVYPNYEILMFATDVKRIISLRDFKGNEDARNLKTVFQKLDNFKYSGDRTGTNIAMVYNNILESMTIEENNDKDNFFETQHIIIIFTDGQDKTGPNFAKPTVNQIKNFVTNYDPKQEKKLDHYVFGVGAEVNTDFLIDLLLEKDQQRHFFKLPDFDEVQKTFNIMPDCGIKHYMAGRIVGGMDAYEGEWPWQVSLHIKSLGHMCGASVISNRWLLTAAHCVQDKEWIKFSQSDQWEVYLGLHNQDETIKSTQKRVKRIISHPQYENTTFDNDIALMELDSPVTFSQNIMPVCLPRATHYFPAGKSVWVTGWGALRWRGDSPSVLQKAEVKIIDSTECNKLLYDKITPRMICAGVLSGGIGSCQGDSGGPLTYTESNGHMFLVGVVNWAYGCAQRNSPSVYARVTEYRSWIREMSGV